LYLESTHANHAGAVVYQNAYGLRTIKLDLEILQKKTYKLIIRSHHSGWQENEEKCHITRNGFSGRFLNALSYDLMVE